MSVYGCGDISTVDWALFDAINAYRVSINKSSVPMGRYSYAIGRLHGEEGAYGEWKYQKTGDASYLGDAADMNGDYCESVNHNMHSWRARSDLWTSCCYTGDHATPECMWEKIDEISGGAITNVLSVENAYGYGFTSETFLKCMDAPDGSVYDLRTRTADHILNGWLGSPGHKVVIDSADNWPEWSTIGVSVTKCFASIWFMDPLKEEICSPSGNQVAETTTTTSTTTTTTSTTTTTTVPPTTDSPYHCGIPNSDCSDKLSNCDDLIHTDLDCMSGIYYDYPNDRWLSDMCPTTCHKKYSVHAACRWATFNGVITQETTTSSTTTTSTTSAPCWGGETIIHETVPIRSTPAPMTNCCDVKGNIPGLDYGCDALEEYSIDMMGCLKMPHPHQELRWKFCPHTCRLATTPGGDSLVVTFCTEWC